MFGCWQIPPWSGEFSIDRELARRRRGHVISEPRRGIYRSQMGAPCSCVVAVTGGGRVRVRGKATEGEKRWARRRWKRPDRPEVQQKAVREPAATTALNHWHGLAPWVQLNCPSTQIFYFTSSDTGSPRLRRPVFKYTDFSVQFKYTHFSVQIYALQIWALGKWLSVLPSSSVELGYT